MHTGMLILVPTPIGNLKDITLRALEVLKSADLILAEDTRTTGFLLKHYEIQNSLQSFHLHNEHKIVDKYIEILKQGKTIALCSDAGTPGISDPGYMMVDAALKNEIKVECLPGATALIPAIVASGFGCERFCYEGFLPLKKGRSTRLKELSIEKRTIVLYESPHRIEKLVKEIIEYMGESKQICIARELSKKFESYLRGSAVYLLQQIQKTPLKGEIVVVIEGSKNKKTTTESDGF